MDPSPRRRSLRVDLTILALVGALMLTAFGVGGVALYRATYGPAAFVERYLDMLDAGRAADALRIPGVALDRPQLEELGLSSTPSDALLRSTVLSGITEVQLLDQSTDEDGIVHVTMGYLAGSAPGTSTFAVVQDGWIGVVPRWRFARSPLAVLKLVVRGADELQVGDFAFDRRQVAGLDSDPLTPVPLLVFAPGLYTVTVDTPVSRADGIRVLIDTPGETTPVDVQTTPTDELIAVVQDRVEHFLDECALQHVLLPTGCPFGFEVEHRLATDPEWSIAQHPTIEIAPDGAHWQILPSSAVAHIEVDVRLIFDGSILNVSEDVPFSINGGVTLLPDGTLSITVGTPD